jgi:2-polyprenyl-3-methyl-5-hydroxy-6-metoxy-1,4-benzoquinol methylase
MSDVIEIAVAPVGACPLCGAEESAELGVAPDTLLPEINRYLPSGHPRLPTDIVLRRRRCAGCGLIFLAPRLDPSSLSKVYELWYGYAYRRVMKDAEHVAERRREFERYHLRLLEAQCPRRGRLLDVGCGSGLFLGLAKRRGWAVTGVELDPATAAWGREHEGIADLRCGVLGSVLRPGEEFDAITLFDYLEHTDQPGSDLDRLVRHLAPGGVLMVRVPNALGWQARLMGPSWLAVMPTHLSYFTAPVLERALVARGLALRHLGAGNYRTELDIVRQRLGWVRRRVAARKKAFGREDGGPPYPSVSDPGAAIRRWLYSLWIEQVDHVGGWFGHGNNLTVIAKKS